MFAKIFGTDSRDTVSLWLRLVLGCVMFPHGAQKALGWFGGAGFAGTLGVFHDALGIPGIFAMLVILAEFIGAVCLISGFATRIAAAGIAAVMIVATAMVHFKNGFFMNWYGQQAGEGFEYHLLVVGLAGALMARGGGSYSFDSRLMNK